LANSVCLIKKSADYKYLSVLSYSQESVVSILGCKYEVKQKKIKQHETIGISNEVTDGVAKVRVHKGIVIVIRSRD
jgi:thiamine pyrophosphokinase